MRPAVCVSVEKAGLGYNATVRCNRKNEKKTGCVRLLVLYVLPKHFLSILSGIKIQGPRETGLVLVCVCCVYLQNMMLCTSTLW